MLSIQSQFRTGITSFFGMSVHLFSPVFPGSLYPILVLLPVFSIIITLLQLFIQLFTLVD